METAALCGGPHSKSIRAFANLKVLCEKHLKGRYRIEVIDLMENPQLAPGDQIIAVPHLIRKASGTCPQDYWRPFRQRAGIGGPDGAEGN